MWSDNDRLYTNYSISIGHLSACRKHQSDIYKFYRSGDRCQTPKWAPVMVEYVRKMTVIVKKSCKHEEYGLSEDLLFLLSEKLVHDLHSRKPFCLQLCHEKKKEMLLYYAVYQLVYFKLGMLTAAIRHFDWDFDLHQRSQLHKVSTIFWVVGYMMGVTAEKSCMCDKFRLLKLWLFVCLLWIYKRNDWYFDNWVRTVGIG